MLSGRRRRTIRPGLAIVVFLLVEVASPGLSGNARAAAPMTVGDHTVGPEGTVGPIEVDCPRGAITISAGTPIQPVIDRHSSATTFCLQAGLHRLASPLLPKRGDTFVFALGAVLDGTRPVTDWTSQGETWMADGQTQAFVMVDYFPCDNNPVACEYEDLFRDGSPLTRVLSQSQVVPGTFYFDELLHRMYVGDDPTGHILEATVTTIGIDASQAPDVVVRNATIRRFGFHGIVGGQNATVESSDISLCHSHGLRLFNGTTVRRSKIHANGTMGIFAYGGKLVFEDNELAYNNYLNFGLATEAWHAGATKIWAAVNGVVRRNWSHHNRGDGWWLDTDNIGMTVEDNLFEENTRYGFFYEISHSGILRNNVFRRNGGGGLWVNTSRDVEVVGNLFEFNRGFSIGLVWDNRGASAQHGEYQMSGFNAHDNVIMFDDSRVGVAYGVERVYSSSNRFESNRYFVADVTAASWNWKGAAIGWDAWRAQGLDAHGTLERIP